MNDIGLARASNVATWPLSTQTKRGSHRVIIRQGSPIRDEQERKSSYKGRAVKGQGWKAWDKAGWRKKWGTSHLWKHSSVQLLSHARLLVTPRTAACQASLSITNSHSLCKVMSIESVTPSNHLILCRPLLLPPSIFPSIWAFSNELVLCIRWPKYWSYSFSISPSNEYLQWVFRTDFLYDGLVGSPCSPRDSQESSPTPQFKSINSSLLSFLHSPTLTSIHDDWKKNYSFD